MTTVALQRVTRKVVLERVGKATLDKGGSGLVSGALVLSPVSEGVGGYDNDPNAAAAPATLQDAAAGTWYLSPTPAILWFKHTAGATGWRPQKDDRDALEEPITLLVDSGAGVDPVAPYPIRNTAEAAVAPTFATTQAALDACPRSSGIDQDAVSIFLEDGEHNLPSELNFSRFDGASINTIVIRSSNGLLAPVAGDLSGTFTLVSGSATGMTLTSGAIPDQTARNYFCRIVSGTGEGQFKPVRSQVGAVLITDGSFSPAPNDTSVVEFVKGSATLNFGDTTPDILMGDMRVLFFEINVQGLAAAAATLSVRGTQNAEAHFGSVAFENLRINMIGPMKLQDVSIKGSGTGYVIKHTNGTLTTFTNNPVFLYGSGAPKGIFQGPQSRGGGLNIIAMTIDGVSGTPGAAFAFENPRVILNKFSNEALQNSFFASMDCKYVFYVRGGANVLLNVSDIISDGLIDSDTADIFVDGDEHSLADLDAAPGKRIVGDWGSQVRGLG